MNNIFQFKGEIIQPQGWEYYQSIAAIAAGRSESDFEENYFKKALTAGTAASGSEFIPTAYSADIIKHVYLKSWARQAFGTMVIPFGDTMKIPKFTSAHSPSGPDYVSTEITTALYSATPIRESSPTTTDITLELKTIAINLQVQNKFIAYNVAPGAVEAYLREDIVKNLVETEEDVIVNGDTDATATNINYSYDATNHPHGYDATHNEWLVMFDGLRNSATGNIVDAGSNAIVTTDFLTAFKNQGKYGVDPNDSIILVSLDLYQNMMDLTAIQTLDKYGPTATVLSGEIGKLFGRAIIVTDKLPCTQKNTLTNTTGIRSSSTATNLYTEALIIYKNAPIIGVPADANRALNVTAKDFPELDRKHYIAREDFAFALRHPEAVVRIVDILA